MSYTSYTSSIPIEVERDRKHRSIETTTETTFTPKGARPNSPPSSPLALCLIGGQERRFHAPRLPLSAAGVARWIENPSVRRNSLTDAVFVGPVPELCPSPGGSVTEFGG